MADLITREAGSWTNVSGPEPEWLTGWLAPSTTAMAAVRGTNFELVVSQLAQAYLTMRPAGIYRVLVACPRSYDVDALLPFSFRRVLGTAIEEPIPARVEPSWMAPEPASERRGGADPSEPVGAVRMVDHLRGWLDLTYDELAEITGVSRAALFYQRTHNAAPRPGTSRRIARFYALADLLVKRFDVNGARAWLTTGDPQPLTLLLAQDFASVERLAREVVFAQPDLRPSDVHGVGDRPQMELSGERAPVTRATRRPKRGPGRAQ